MYSSLPVQLCKSDVTQKLMKEALIKEQLEQTCNFNHAVTGFMLIMACCLLTLNNSRYIKKTKPILWAYKYFPITTSCFYGCKFIAFSLGTKFHYYLKHLPQKLIYLIL